MPKQTGTPDVRYNLKSQKDKNKATLVSSVFRYQSKDEKLRLVYSSRLKIAPKHWDSNKQLPRTSYPHYNSHKETLNALTSAIHSIYLDHNKGEISVEQFKYKLDVQLGRIEPEPTQKDVAPTLFSFIKDFIIRRESEANANRNTYKKFTTVQNHLVNYADEKRHGVLDFDDIDWKFRNDFVNWLYEMPRNHSVNNAHKIIRVLKQFMKQALRENLHSNLIYQDSDFSVKEQRIEKTVLTYDDIKLIHHLDLSTNPKLDRVRDLFLIGCYTGLRISDFKRIRPECKIRSN